MPKNDKELAKQGSGKIDIEVIAQRSMIKLCAPEVLPAMVSLKTEGGARSSVDLICVLDVSGSMGGEKIELLRKTVTFLIEQLQ